MPDTIPPPAGDESGDDIDVDFEDWAVISARLLGRSVIERAQTLRDSGLVAHWAQIDEHWYEALVQDLDAGRLTRLDRYVDICVAERATRTELKTLPGLADAEEEPSAAESMSSATPPLGSSAESIEIDLADLELRDSLTREHEALDDDEEDDHEGPHSDDTRVSAAFPELPGTEKDA